MTEEAYRSPNRAFTIVRGVIKLVAVVLGGAVTLIALMSVVGSFVSNVWIRLGVALVVAVALPAILADRLLPEDSKEGRGIVTDTFALCWLGFAFLYVVLGASLTRPLLHTEAERLTGADMPRLGGVTDWLAGSSQSDEASAAPARRDPAARAPGKDGKESKDGKAGKDGEAGSGGAQQAKKPDQTDPPGGQPDKQPGKPGADVPGAAGKPGAGGETTAAPPAGKNDPGPVAGSSEPGKEFTPAEIFKLWAPSVVTVVVDKDIMGGGSGTGFFIGSDGTMVTNHHVIDGARDVRVKLMDGKWAKEVTLLVADKDADIAILRVAVDEAPVPIRMGDSEKLVVGERAISIGNPLGLEHTLTDGLISARRTVNGRRMIQMSTPISPGNSGGPLFNLHGEVIGVSTATMSAFGSGQNLNLAVPIDTVKGMIRDDYPDQKRIGGGGPDMGRW